MSNRFAGNIAVQATRWVLIGWCVLMPLLGAAAAAADVVPPALAPWQDWVLRNHPDATCTRLAADPAQRRCVWPGRLMLAVSERGGSFSQLLQVEAAGWVALPGDRDHWPLRLTVDGRGVTALDHDGRPMLWLTPGDYLLRGNFDWQGLPQSLAVPASTALLDLNVNDRPVAVPDRDAAGRVWLRKRTGAAAGRAENSVRVDVFRLIDDGIPRLLDTTLRLSVSGKPRELRLGRFLVADAEPVSFDSPLPARIEDDGSLRVQARAGQWLIHMRARLLHDDNTFVVQRQPPDWPAQEIWRFRARPALRRVRVEGAPSVDPAQLDLPDGFKQLPTYLLRTGDKLVLKQLTRGDAVPAPNELTLVRTVWLDFAGTGATVRDAISGKLNHGWRLQADPALHLGRVRVDGKPRLITRLQADGTEGVEIRDPAVDLDAVSRIDSIGQLGAANWQTGFNSATVHLQLPPGWELWHASGPDRVSSSWVVRWNLWAIFVSLLVVAAVLRLLGWRWALLAAATVALVYQEDTALVLLLLPLLAVLALLKVVAGATAQRRIRGAGHGLAALLALTVVAFAVIQIRAAIYPQLELPAAVAGAARPMVLQAKGSARLASDKAMVAEQQRMATPAAAPPPPRYAADDNAQTGPGEPDWHWRSLTLQWSGPVAAGQSLQLYLSPPWLTRLLKVLEVLLAAGLTAGLWRALRGSGGSGGSTAGSPTLPALAVMALLGALLTAAPTPARAADFPPQPLLDALREQLLQAPHCAPDCTALESAQITADNERLVVRLRIGVAADLAVALPTVSDWQPRSVLVDGLQVTALGRDTGGASLLPLERGSHEVVLEGPVTTDSVTLQFAQKPHKVRVTATAWDVSGLNGETLRANTLQLQRRAATTPDDTLLPAPARPFVRVVRRFEFGIDWRVTTTVERVAPARGGIDLKVPLLPGEAVLSGNVEAVDGRVPVSLGSDQHSLSWQSTLRQVPVLTLTAARTTQWVSEWRVAAAPRWHLEASGLTPIRTAGAERLWRPWPGETLTLKLQRPQAVPGPTTTVENAQLTLTPGVRNSTFDASLRIDSSVGGDYRVDPGAHATLKSATVNGTAVTPSQQDGALLLPLVPGKNQVAIRWELQHGVTLMTRTPSLRLASPGNNIRLQLHLPRDRWALWVTGPAMGPALLYWGVLVVIVGVALVLGAIGRKWQLSIPLRSWQWLLLLVGISTINIAGSLPILLWFAALEARRRWPPPHNDFFYLAQVGIGLLSLVALLTLATVIPQSLLAAPDMQVVGNGSGNYLFNWYQDHSGAALPQAGVISLPLWCYRAAMLVWSLWLVFALLRWVKWGWGCFAEGGVWPAHPRRDKANPAAPAVPENQDRS